MGKPIRILILEDNDDDAFFLLRQLRQEGYEPEYKILDTREDLEQALDRKPWDIIISDYVMPQFSGLDAIKVIREKGKDIPCIIISGKIGEATAVEAMRSGARDFITKSDLSRLGPAIEREIHEAAIRKEHRRTEEKLKESNEFNAILLNESPMPIVAVNPDSTIRYVNKAAENLTGFTASQLIGSRAPYLFWPKEKYSEYLQEMTGDSFEQVRVFQKLFCNRQGEEFWVEVTIIPVRVNNKLEHILSTWVNLSEEKKLRRELELFNHKVIQAQEEERKRIARELHEDTAQLLAIIKMELESLGRSREIKSKETLEKLGILQENTSHVIQDIRRFSYALRPGDLDYLGLDTALEQLAEEAGDRERLPIELKVIGESRRLAGDMELVLYRIAQESLINIQKHSRATKAVIRLEYLPQVIRLTVQDNGRGFDPEKELEVGVSRGRLGLIGMRERARLIHADLMIKSGTNKGTTIIVDLKT